MTDPIADMLTRIRNALAVKKSNVLVPSSRLKEQIARIFEQGGWVKSVERRGQKNRDVLEIHLKYSSDGEPQIRFLKRRSTPGRKVYVGAKDIPMVLNNLGIAILSTSRGVMTNREARQLGIGGEVLCEIA